MSNNDAFALVMSIIAFIVAIMTFAIKVFC